jgi:hypothetical protein
VRRVKENADVAGEETTRLPKCEDHWNMRFDQEKYRVKPIIDELVKPLQWLPNNEQLLEEVQVVMESNVMQDKADSESGSDDCDGDLEEQSNDSSGASHDDDRAISGRSTDSVRRVMVPGMGLLIPSVVLTMAMMDQCLWTCGQVTRSSQGIFELKPYGSV